MTVPIRARHTVTDCLLTIAPPSPTPNTGRSGADYHAAYDDRVTHSGSDGSTVPVFQSSRVEQPWNGGTLEPWNLGTLEPPLICWEDTSTSPAPVPSDRRTDAARRTAP